ncbi:hypothetical protein REIP_1574 [Rickettsia endosymbiont of Ixodes pacificus]|nr:hypothetical protein REIP_1574 [Rickettsia endosymbiont of Ixodes pacificus]
MMNKISFYKQQILNNNRGRYLALEEIKQYFQLEKVRLLSRINLLFKDVLNCSDDSFGTTVINRFFKLINSNYH